MKFQDDILNMNTYIHTYIHTYVHTYGQAETNMPPHFFKVGGITIYPLYTSYTGGINKGRNSVANLRKNNDLQY